MTDYVLLAEDLGFLLLMSGDIIRSVLLIREKEKRLFCHSVGWEVLELEDEVLGTEPGSLLNL